MGIYVFSALCLFLILFFWRTKSCKTIYLRKLVLPAVCVIFILCLIISSKTAVSSAAKGLNLWLNIVFPSLFPFFVASYLLNGTGFIRAVGILLEPIMRPLFNVPGCGSFTFAMGITSGYPVGAKITSEMRKDKLLTKTEAERLLAFTNNSGPLFIVGAVAVGMFKMPQLGIFLLVCHIAACITVGILFRFYGRDKGSYDFKKYNGQLLSRFKKELLSSSKGPQTNFGILLGNAIKDSVMMMLAIGGFIILFSVIINLLLDIGIIRRVSAVISAILTPFGVSYDIVASIISGLFEITTGTNMASKVTGVTIEQQLAATSFIIGWAGLSVHSQVLSIVSETDISVKPYFLGKFLQGVFSGVYTFIGLKAVGYLFPGSRPVFARMHVPWLPQWQDFFIISCKYLLAALVLLLLLALVSYAASVVLRAGRRISIKS